MSQKTTIMREPDGSVELALSSLPAGSYAGRDFKGMANVAIDTRIAGLTPGSTTQDIFSTRNDGASTYVRSGTCFAADVRLTFVSVWSNETTVNGAQKTVTLIAPNLGLSAHHTDVTTGKLYRFVDAAGVETELIVADHTEIGDTDIELVEFTTAAPASIGFAKVLSPELQAALLSAALITIDRNQALHVAELGNGGLLAPTAVSLVDPSESTRHSFYSIGISGDSGHPWFVLLDGEAVLATTFWGEDNGPSLAFYLAAINTAMAAYGSARLTLFQGTALSKAAVGLALADNTPDALKEVALATYSEGLKNGDSLAPVLYVDASGWNFASDPAGGTANDVTIDSVILAKLRAALSGVVGAAGFDALSGTIANKFVRGCIADVVRAGPGAYNVSFTAALPDTAYCVQVSCVANDDGAVAYVTILGVSAFQIFFQDAANTQLDQNEVRITVIRLV